MTKVVVVFAGNEQGGAATHLLAYLRALQDGGLSSEVLFLSIGEGPLWDSVHNLEPTAEALRGGMRNLMQGLRNRMVQFGGQVLWHAHGPRLNVMVYVASRSTGARFTSTIHSNPMKDFLGSKMKSALFTRLNLFCLRRAAGLFVGSRVFEEFFPSNRCFFVPNAIQATTNTDSEDVLSEQCEALRNAYNLPEKARVMGVIARFDPVKDISTAIRALSLLNKSRGAEGTQALSSPVHLVVAGDGGERERLHGLVHELGLDEFVHFVGFVSDVRPVLHCISALILPSHSEGESPFVILEAGTNGVPSIGSDIPGIRNLIDDEKTGLLFPVGKAEALAEAADRILRDAAFADELSQNFRTQVLPRFSPAGMLDAYRQGYREMGCDV